MMEETLKNIRSLVSDEKFDEALSLLNSIEIDLIDNIQITNLEYYFLKLRCFIGKNDMTNSIQLMDEIVITPYKNFFPLGVCSIVPSFTDILFVFLTKFQSEYQTYASKEKIETYKNFMRNYGYLDKQSNGFFYYKIFEAIDLVPTSIDKTNITNSYYQFLVESVMIDNSNIDRGNKDVFVQAAKYLAFISSSEDDKKLFFDRYTELLNISL